MNYLRVLGIIALLVTGSCEKQSVEQSATHSPDPGALGGSVGCLLRATPHATGLRVHVEMTNTGKAEVALLSWRLGVDGVLTSDLFTVHKGSDAVAYKGPMIKRGKPVESDYMRLGPGENLKFDVEMLQYYDLTRGAGYTIKYSALVLRQKDALDRRVESNEVITKW